MPNIFEKLFNNELLRQILNEDDIAILFYKENKIHRGTIEEFRSSWVEEWQYNSDMQEFLEDVGDETSIFVCLDEEDKAKTWKEVWDGLKWNEDSETYRYGNWELFVLNI